MEPIIVVRGNTEPDLSWMDGLYVGLLSESELRDFDAAVRDGRAMRSYEGTGGFMGLPKVRLISPAQSLQSEQKEAGVSSTPSGGDQDE